METRAETIDLRVPDGTMVTFSYSPADNERHPAVIVCQEALGVNDHVKSLARQFAEHGYFATAPDFYHRSGRNNVATNMEEAAPLRVGMTDDGIVDDLKSVVNYLSDHPDVQAARIGIMGCCQGGRTSFIGASRVPGIVASVVYYGGGIIPREDAPLNERQSSVHPIHYADHVSCPMIGFFGARDARIPVSVFRELEATMTRLGKDAEFHLYPGAGHGFLNPEGDSFHPTAAADAWERTLAFLAKHLRGARVAAL